MPDWGKLLHKNRFFPVTALTGWNFIYEAKTRNQILVWYLVIIAFGLLTILNVHQLLVHYASSPIKYDVLLSSSTRDLGIPNLTLTYEMPLVELITHSLPSKFSKPEESLNYVTSFGLFHNYLCTDGGSFDFVQNEKTREKFVLSSIIEAMRDEAEMKFAQLNFGERAGPADTWLSELKVMKQLLLDQFRSVLSADVDQLKSSNASLIYEPMNDPVKNRSSDTFLKLLILESLNRDDNPSNRLGQGVPPSSAQALLEQHHVTAKQLLENTVTQLNRILHIDAGPNASVNFDQWTVSTVHFETTDLDPMMRTEPKQIFTFSMEVTSGVREITLSLYSFVSAWLRNVIKVWQEIILAHGDHPCPTNVPRMYETCEDVWNNWVDYMAFRSKLQLHLPNGESVTVGPDKEYLVTVSPTVYFLSQIENCFGGSVISCIEKCRSKAYIDACSCVPWTIHRENPNQAVCDAPCLVPNLEEWCQNACEDKALHSCNTLMARIEKDPNSLGLAVTADETLKCHIQMSENTNYLRASAEYEMTLSGLLALLGGSVEFWGTISVAGLIHLTVYLMINIHRSFVSNRVLPTTTKDKASVDLTTLDDFEDEISELKDRMAVLKKIENQPWWLWFSGNRFFLETPMAAFAFIASARNRTEAAVWYLVIVLFAGIGTANLYYVLKQFSESHTHISLTPSAASISSIPNLTLDLYLPKCELVPDLFDIKPQYDPKKPLTWNKMYELYQFYTVNWMMEYLREFEAEINGHLHAGLQQQPLKTNTKAKRLSLSNANTLKNWESLFKNATNLLSNVFDNENQYTNMQIQQAIRKFYQSTLSYGGRNQLFSKLLLLEKIQEGNTSSASEIDDFGWRTEELMASTVSSLSKILVVKVSQGASVFLTGVSLPYNASYVALRLKVNVPIGCHQLNIEIHSLLHSLELEAMNFRGAHVGTSYAQESLGIHQLHFYRYLWLTLENIKVVLVAANMEQQTIYHNAVSVDIPLSTQWQYVSARTGCVNETIGECMDKCLLSKYDQYCDCVPWDLQHVNPKAKLCSAPCNQVDKNRCDSFCTKSICNQYQLRPGEQILTDEVNPNLFKFRVSLKQNVHLKLLERYDLPTEQLMGELGALADFWLGINLFAAVHATIYLLRWLKKKIIYKSKLSPDDTSYRLEFLTQQLAVTNETLNRLEKTVEILRLKIRRGTSVERKQHFGWLWSNGFYSETPMNYFSFISPRHKLVSIFWYLILIVFSIFTLTFVYSAFAHYTSGPTKVTASFIAEQQELNLGNISIEFRIPLLEMSMRNPTAVRVQRYNPGFTFGTVNEKLACAMYQCGSDNVCSSDYALEELLNAMLEGWLQFDAWNIADEDQKSSDFAFTTNLAKWHEILEQSKQDLLEFLNQNHEEKMPGDIDERNNLWKEFIEILDAPMRQLSNKSHVFFLLLEAFETGISPQTKLKKVVKDLADHKDLNVTAAVGDKTVKELMAGWSGLEIYQKAQQLLSQMLHVSAPGVDVSLQDWTYEPGQDPYMNRLPHQRVKLRVGIPTNSNMSQFNIQISSFSQIWHHYIMEMFKLHYSVVNGTLGRLGCSSTDIDGTTAHIEMEYYQMWWTHELDPLIVETQGGSKAHGHKWSQTSVEVHTATTISSSIDNCFSGSFEQCAAECLSHVYLDLCGCVPYSMIYLGEEQVCIEPCAMDSEARADCEDLCEKQTNHPCLANIVKITENNIGIPQIEITAAENYQTPLPKCWEFDTIDCYYFPTYNLTIRKSKVKTGIVKYSESYDETFGGFVNTLAGLCDLWLGINMLSVIHLLVYIFKMTAFKIKHRNKIDEDQVIQKTMDEETKLQRQEHRLKKWLQTIKCDIESEITANK